MPSYCFAVRMIAITMLAALVEHYAMPSPPICFRGHFLTGVAQWRGPLAAAIRFRGLFCGRCCCKPIWRLLRPLVLRLQVAPRVCFAGQLLRLGRLHEVRSGMNELVSHNISQFDKPSQRLGLIVMIQILRGSYLHFCLRVIVWFLCM